MRDTIIQVLGDELNPIFLDVIDESHMHSRATAQVPQTHFRVVVVSDKFKDLSPVKRQQLVYTLLARLFTNGLHALAQQTFTPDEWSAQSYLVQSPACASSKP